MKIMNHIEVSKSLIKIIVTRFPTKIFKLNTTLFYEGHIPISGFLIIEGSILISSKNNFKQVLTAGTLLGISDLIGKNPSNIQADVLPNSEICFLDKSTIQEVSQKNDSELSIFLCQLMENRV
jgi:CRP-like cAMP-binding protein